VEIILQDSGMKTVQQASSPTQSRQMQLCSQNKRWTKICTGNKLTHNEWLRQK